MQLEVTFRLEVAPGGKLVSDWIKKLKETDDQQTQKNANEVALRLHQAAMTKAKAPAFWSSIQDQIETDCAELREVFTDNVSRQCTFQRFDNRCELHSHNEERQIVILGLNIDALAISESAFKGSHSKRTEERSTLTLQVDSKDRLYLRRGTAIFTDVAEISEMLIKRACDLHD